MVLSSFMAVYSNRGYAEKDRFDGELFVTAKQGKPLKQTSECVLDT